MAEEKNIKITHGIGLIDTIITMAIFILFLNWVKPNFVPGWLYTIAFWFVIFILIIAGIVLLILGIVYIVVKIASRW